MDSPQGSGEPKAKQSLIESGGRHADAAAWARCRNKMAENEPATQGKHAATMEDVARISRVSRATVSRVLSGADNVRSATRETVLKAARELNYQPNLAAQGLRGGRSYFVGMIVDNVTDVTGAMIHTVEARCKERGYTVVLCIAGNQKPAAEAWLARNAYLEGVIFLRSGIHKALWERPKALRTVYAYCLAEDEPADCVLPDNVQGAFDATQCLIGLGHRRIAFINGPPSWEAHDTRHRGYALALAERGLAFDPERVVQGTGRYESGYELAAALLARAPSQRPTAIFACNDRMAAGALAAATAAGIAVPGELSVIGFENKEFTQYTTPRLSTVELPLADVALLAVDRLLDGLESPASSPRPLTKVNCRLVLRDSTGPAPS